MTNEKSDERSTAKSAEVLVKAIVDENNILAQDMLEKILAQKVDARYDEVMQNG